MDPKKISTKTIMVYFSIDFDIKLIASNRFKFIDTSRVVAPLTKKNKQIDRKKIKAPYGDIFSSDYQGNIIGLDLRKKKKTTSRIPYFLNQIMFFVSLGDMNVNVMMFKNKFKISGCKTDDHAMQTVKIFWYKFRSTENIKDNFFSLKPKFDYPFFILETVMMNTGFNLKYYIRRKELNKIMNDPEYKDKVLLSQYESTTHPNVNIKMFSTCPVDHTFVKMELDTCPINKDIESFCKFNCTYTQVFENVFKKEKKKVDQDTFIVFSSGQVIVTGRYLSKMIENCNFFMKIIETKLVNSQK